MTAPMSHGPPPDPREERFRPLGEFLLAETIAVGVLAVLTLVLPDPLGEATAGGMLALLVGIPVVRVIWLVGRWWSRGDRRYAAVGLAVLAVLVIGAVLSH